MPHLGFVQNKPYDVNTGPAALAGIITGENTIALLEITRRPREPVLQSTSWREAYGCVAGSPDGPPSGSRTTFSSFLTFPGAPSEDGGWPPATLGDSSSTPASGTRALNVKSRLFDRSVSHVLIFRAGGDTAHCASLFRGPMKRCE